MNANLDLKSVINELGPEFAARASEVDQNDLFVAENLEKLKHRGAYKALIPTDLGGAGSSYTDMCQFLRTLAGYCGSTALTLSMHQHLVAAQVMSFLNGKPVRALLERIAREDLVLISTGGGDWLSSNGEAVRVDGGYRVTSSKYFSSGCLIGDIAMTSCAYRDSDGDEHVLHFGVGLKEEGVSIEENWKAMGMRGSGSHSIHMKDVFISDERVGLMRQRGAWHPIWDLVGTVAFPLFMAPYVGIAEEMHGRVVRQLSKRRVSPAIASVLGEMNNQLRIAQLAIDDIVSAVGDWTIKPSLVSANRCLTAKTLIARSVREMAQKAMEAMGGRAYFRDIELERMYRDLLAAEFHPLQESKQREASGHVLLGGTPADIA